MCNTVAVDTIIAVIVIDHRMSGRQKYLLPAMDMAEVGGPLSIVNDWQKFKYPMSTSHY